MKEKLFKELLASVKEGGAILRGKKKPSRNFTHPPVDVARVRAKTHLSQREFAQVIGISVATLRNWEQGRREPKGPARCLLQVADKDFGALLKISPALSR